MKKALFTLLVILISACSLTPDKKDVQTVKPAESYRSLSTTVNANTVQPSKWWELFNDEELAAVIEKVIANNLDLKLAVSRVELLETQFDINRGRRYPAVTASASYQKSKSPVPSMQFDPNNGMSSTIESQTNDQYTLRSGLRFEIDLFGKLKSLEKSAYNELLSSKSDLQTVYLGLIARTALLYYDIRSLQKQITVSSENVELYQVLYNLEKERYQRGVGSTLNIDMTTQLLKAAKAQLISQKQLLNMRNHELAILMSRYPDEMIKPTETSTLPTDFAPIPVSIPSELLKNRSDIIAAEHKLDAAREMIGFARADMFPTISLTAAIGYMNLTELDNLFTSDYLTRSIGVDATGTLFAGGSKSAAVEQKKVIYLQAELNYKKSVLTAFAEVEDALTQLESSRQRLAALEDSYSSAKRAFTESDKRYKRGLIPYTRLLDSQKSLFQTRSALIDAQKQLVYSRINLHRALGGSWIDSEKILEQHSRNKEE